MQMTLELIPLPVSDVDRAIAFYADKLGFKKDFDVQPSEGVRVVQLTPEGSGCSVGFGTGLDVYAENPAALEACTWLWRTSTRRVPSLSAEV
jgi:catechol 2,3-dioxygenase-like lactoylglutathione lyase family enzyme